MTFNPSSTICLCNVPIDNTYKHQIYFSSMAEQKEYFSQRVVKTFSEYLTVRKTLADGSLQSSIKVNANIDDLYNCNYMYYQNKNHSLRYFYAFITKLIYVNEGTTEIVFETDVYQTWRFFTELKESYVVREHSVTDNVGDNVVPEKFNIQDYVYAEVESSNGWGDISEYGYLIGTSDFVKVSEGDVNAKPTLYSGIYQGLYFYFFPDNVGVQSFMSSLDKDIVQFICTIPTFNVGYAKLEDDHTIYGAIDGSTTPKMNTVDYVLDVKASKMFNGYEPKNKKLFTSPYRNFIITNNAGDVAEYNIEEFVMKSILTFTMYGDISANPSVTLIPSNYKGVSSNVDFGITISNFPQCSYVSDTFKLWLAKNQFGLAIDTATSLGNIVAGVAVTAGTGGAGAAIGVQQVASGVTGILNTVNSVYKASKEPNGTKIGAVKNNLLTGMKRNTFDAYIRTIKGEHAETIDNFFTMYGYQTNKLKVPNCSSRPYFNYVQTVDANVVGTIPDDDMTTLKNMYNSGVTFWKPNATVCDYSVDNSPKVGE